MQPLLAEVGSTSGGVAAVPSIEAYRQNYRAWRMGGNRGAKDALLRQVRRARGAPLRCLPAFRALALGAHDAVWTPSATFWRM
eukprot:4778881-Prymnesium_polylepis.1